MPGGGHSEWSVERGIGVVAVVIALIGYFGFGWRFGADNGPVATGVGILVAVVAVGVVLYRRYAD